MKIAFAGFCHSHIFTLYEMAKNHADYEIVDACEESEEYRALAKEKGVTFTYENYDDMLKNTQAEVIAIGSCYGDRGSMAISALKSNKSVICDKPLCTSIAELDEIERLAKEKNLLVSCMYTMRFEPKMRAVKSLIDSGALGKIHNVYFGGQHPLQYGRRPSWYFEEGKHGGVINDIAIHGIDTLKFLFGFDLDKINGARCWNAYASYEKNFKDCAQLMLTGKNGEGVIADVSYAVPDGVEFALPYYWQFYLWGEKGTLSYTYNGETSYFVKGDKEKKVLNEESTVDYLTDFYNLKNGKQAILPTQEVFASTRATLLIQNSANEN
jgi:predicted dehydrogenase